MSLIRGLRAVLSFLTIVPAGGGTLEEVARHAYLFPVAGALIGLICGIPAFFAFRYLPGAVASWVVISLLALVTGLTHLDSLLDLGDALMVRGTAERRLQVLHDRCHGIGGTALLIISIGVTQSLFAPLSRAIIPALVTAEVFSKLSMVLLGAMGRPHSTGLGSVFVSQLARNRPFYIAASSAIAVAVALLSLVPPPAVIILLGTVLALSLLLSRRFVRMFGCVTGDMIGSHGELCRIASLLVMLVVGAQ